MARTFAVDSPRLFEFKLDGSDEVHSIPLASSMPYRFIQQVRRSRADMDYAIIEEYCPELLDTDISAGTVKEIMDAWGEASREDGAAPGESRASSKR